MFAAAKTYEQIYQIDIENQSKIHIKFEDVLDCQNHKNFIEKIIVNIMVSEDLHILMQL